MGEETVLRENAADFLKQAERAEGDGSFNPAATLFFKAMAVLADLLILQKEGFIPSNHAERFRLLKSKYPELYRILDRDFPLYQNSYSLKISKKTLEVLKKDAKRVAEIAGFKPNSQAVCLKA
ncbi:MAG: hypothetical protein QME12_07285 [Nanoarchaeota archaeon]|nr:hypothetical protein [Nanoarchaeota archaeon]